MRIYDLHETLDNLIQDGNYQIELIGEDGIWQYKLSRRHWSNEKQRYDYEEMYCASAPHFLSFSDDIASEIIHDRDL